MKKNSADTYFEIVKKLSPITLDILTAETDEDFDNAFDSWLEHGLAQLEKSSKEYTVLSENGLSNVLTSALSTGEISVTREENSNGHVDLTVKLTNPKSYRVKLGEAKIWGGREYHVKGLGQLLERYTTGRECRGFVISFVKIKDIENLFKDLREHLDNEKPFELQKLCKNHSIKWAFLSDHNHSSGRLVEVCHVGCNLFVS